MGRLRAPAGSSAWERQTAAPQSTLITTQLHIKRESEDIVAAVSWREVTKVACRFKDGALWQIIKAQDFENLYMQSNGIT